MTHRGLILQGPRQGQWLSFGGDHYSFHQPTRSRRPGPVVAMPETESVTTITLHHKIFREGSDVMGFWAPKEWSGMDCLRYLIERAYNTLDPHR